MVDNIYTVHINWSGVVVTVSDWSWFKSEIVSLVCLHSLTIAGVSLLRYLINGTFADKLRHFYAPT